MVTRGFVGRQDSNDQRSRIPPGQHVVTDFPVLSAGPTPRIRTDDWTFTLKVGPRAVAKWNWAEFYALPQTKMTRDIHCVTTWSKLNAPWEGVLIDDLLGEANLEPSTAYTLAHSYDGYSTNVPSADLIGGKAMVATKYAGQPLAAEHGVIRRIENLSPRVKSFFFRLAGPIAFRPGQHVLLRLTAPDGYHAQRSYSIASAPGLHKIEELELAIERLDDGEVSPFMHDTAQVGDEIELGGPIGGHFNWSPEDGGPVLFIGGGSGVVPFMSMLRHRAAIGSRVPVTLVFSARSREDLLFFDELSELAAPGDGFSLMVTLTREATAHPFRAGRIDAAFIAGIVAAIKMPIRQVMICGSNPFVEAAAEGTIAAGIDEALIKTERYGV
jgi:glycine betaine catabolism B